MKSIKVIDIVNTKEFEFKDIGDNCILTPNTIDGFEYANVKNVIDSIPGEIGAAFIASSFGQRLVTWGGDIIGSDPFATRREMLAAMRQNGALKTIEITTYDDLELQFNANITKVIAPYTHQIHTFQIQAIAPDYRLYTQALHNQTMQESQIFGGTPIPTPIPIDFSGSTSTGGVVFNNAGNEQTPVEFTLHGPGNGFTVRNDTLQQQFRINYELELGDEVVVNTKERTVRFNGIYNIYSALEGYFWELQPGDNLIYFVADSDADSNTELDLEWRDAYNGV